MADGEVIFVVEESPEGGYEAGALGHSIFTQADSIDELRTMVRDAVSYHFDESDRHPAPSRPGRTHRDVRLPRDLSGDALASRGHDRLFKPHALPPGGGAEWFFDPQIRPRTSEKWHVEEPTLWPIPVRDFDDVPPILPRARARRAPPAKPPLRPQDRVITVGSCFADELRRYLGIAGFGTGDFQVPSSLNNTFASSTSSRDV
jgi:hypothetical protein